MKRLFLFNASARSRLYGIGNYVDIVYQTLRRRAGIKVILIDFFQVQGEEYIEVESDGQAEKFNCYLSGQSLYTLPCKELFGYLNTEYNLNSSDIFHFNTPNHGRMAQLLQIEIQPKIVYTAHFNTLKLEVDKDATLVNENRLIQVADHIICLSEEAKNYISSIGERGSVSIIKTPLLTVDKAQIQKNKILLRASLRLSNDNLILLFNGRIDPQKGFNDILEIFPKLLKAFPKLVLIVVGDGNFSEIITKSRAFIGHIIFIGYVDRKNRNYLRKLYQIADVFVLPSYNEQLSLSFLEAAANAVPAVVSDIPAFAQFSNDHVKKVRITKTNRIDQQDLYSKIIELLISKEYRGILGEALHKYCQKIYNKQNFSTSLLKIYDV